MGSKSKGSEAKKIKDLKIELLRNPTKRGRIKKEIARLLTMENTLNKKKNIVDEKIKFGKNKNKSKEGYK